MSSRTNRFGFGLGLGLVVTIRFLAAACSPGSASAAMAAGTDAAHRTTAPGTSVAGSGLPDPVNNAGPVNPDEIASSVGEVVNDEGAISSYLYQSL